MKMSDDGLDLIKRSEGLELVAYPDPASGGDPWTIGHGHTRGVRRGDRCSVGQAAAWLAEDVSAFETMVNGYISQPMTQGQFDALVSFAYNMGPGGKGVKDGFVVLASGNSPSIRRHFNAGNWKLAADEFPKWANPPLPGLVIRRARERNMFLGRDWRVIPDGDHDGHAERIARQNNAVPA